MKNYLVFENYPYLGTYDVFITYVHEMFHILEQPTWTESEVSNSDRDERLYDTAAREKRNLLQHQLLAAAAGDDEELIRQACATWVDYKENFAEDYEASLYFDRTEGTAHYFEIKACLYAAYPEFVKTEADFQKAVALYASRPEFEVGVGTVREGYCIGAMGCVLLDRLGIADWQRTLMENPKMSALDILTANCGDLPAASDVTQENKDETGKQIETFNSDDSRWNGIFEMFYHLLF